MTPVRAFRESPGGRAPDAILNELRSRPVTAKVWLYACPTTAPGAVGLVNVGGVAPSSPLSLSPQQTTLPSVLVPQAWASPPVTPSRALPGGVASPESFLPQHATLPSAFTPQPNQLPRSICV